MDKKRASMFCTKCGRRIDQSRRVCEQCAAAESRDDAPAPSAEPAAPQGAGDPLIGRTIDKRYVIESKIGVGGMGAVYTAKRLLISDIVAVKILSPETMTDRQAVERFRREAQAAARLKHPNAVAVYDFGISSEEMPYLVMELVEGKSIRSLVNERGPLEPAFAVEIIAQVCAALDEAHRHNIVHRDVKPDNILVTRTARGFHAKVLDFGIAKLRDVPSGTGKLTQAGMLIGTPDYMSPEQCLGAELDGRSDIYSLGIVLFEMLCGVVPFVAPTPTGVVVQQVHDPPPLPRSLNPAIPASLEVAVLQALAKAREDRPQTAHAFADELLAVVNAPGFAAPAAEPPPAVSEALTLVLGDQVPTPVATPMPGSPTPVPVSRPTGPTPAADVAVSPAAPAPVESNLKRRAVLFGILGAILGLASVTGFALWLQRAPVAPSPQPQAPSPQPPAPSPQTQAPSPPVSAPAATPAPPPGMVYVPGGDFLMGSETGDEYERPQHPVTVGPFFIDQYEVTCEEYGKFVAATGHRAPPGWVNGRYPEGTARRPVTGVDWDDANAYAKWAGKRLPTEREWELAARGADARRYPWGNDWKSGLANADEGSLGRMADVGAYAEGKSPFGVFDTAGNAWEWTASNLTVYPGSTLKVPPGDDLRVIRGGYWKSNKDQATTTYRGAWPARTGSDYGNTSFRCAKDVSGQ